MRTLTHHGNGSTPRLFQQIARRVAERTGVAAALSPTVGDILSPSLRARLRGDDGPSPLWARVLAAARALSVDDAERALLERTRLVDCDVELFSVAVAATPFTPEQRLLLRTRLTAALRQVGFRDCRVTLISSSAPDGDDAE
jgi:hypothetical protein